jgi:hypothetical protein
MAAWREKFWRIRSRKSPLSVSFIAVPLTAAKVAWPGGFDKIAIQLTMFLSQATAFRSRGLSDVCPRNLLRLRIAFAYFATGSLLNDAQQDYDQSNLRAS